MNNTPARIFLNGVEQHHCRDYSTAAGWLIKRKQTATGTMVLNPDKTYATERLEGEVVAIGDDSFVGGTVVYTPVDDDGGNPVTKVSTTITYADGTAKTVAGSVS